jgi:Ca2+-binding RTX toxin-like protein
VRRRAIGALRGSWAPPGAIHHASPEEREAALGAEVGEVERLERPILPAGLAPGDPVEGAVGGSGADRFFGDAQANLFRSNAGKDTATGGGGRDLYDYNLVADSPVGTGRDVIADFAPGVDDLDLSGVDANSTVAGDQTFRFVGTAALGTAPGAVGYFSSGGNTVVRASTDADSTAELEIQLTGLKNLTVDDFYL